MAFTFSIIEWSSVTDPSSLFRKTGPAEGDSGSGGTPGTTQVSFTAVSTAQITTATLAGADDYPDDGGARLAASVTLNGTTYSAGANVEADFEVILRDTTTGYYYRATWLAIGNQPVGISLSRAWNATTGQFVAGPTGVYTPGRSLTLVDGDVLDGTPNASAFATDGNYVSNGIGNDAVLNSSNGTVICFARGTMIATHLGEVPVERLSQGHLVLTRDNGYQPIRWIGSVRLGTADLALRPHLRPIRIQAGALGNGLPSTDLMVSPQHRVLVTSVVAQRMFDEREVLVAAKHLTAMPGIEIAHEVAQVEYWHFLLDAHQVVLSNGAPTESLFTGPEALKAVPEPSRREILQIFPQLTEINHAAQPVPARMLIPGRRASHFAERVVKNQHDLIA